MQLAYPGVLVRAPPPAFDWVRDGRTVSKSKRLVHDLIGERRDVSWVCPRGVACVLAADHEKGGVVPTKETRYASAETERSR